MSKYIDLEDAIGIIQKEIDKVVIESDYDNTFRVGLRLAKNMLLDLPTIEVSEDCISRLEVLELLNAMMAVDSANSKVYAKVFLQVKDAPSVVPKDHNGESTEMVDIDDLIEQADNLIAFEKEMIADTEKG